MELFSDDFLNIVQKEKFDSYEYLSCNSKRLVPYSLKNFFKNKGEGALEHNKNYLVLATGFEYTPENYQALCYVINKKTLVGTNGTISFSRKTKKINKKEVLDIQPQTSFVISKDWESVIINGDDNGELSENIIFEDNLPITKVVVSFNCLSRLAFDGRINRKRITSLLSSDKLRCIDSTEDQRISMKKSKKCPGAGFTLVDRSWHRPGGALFQLRDTFYMLGQDENSYFGCELPQDKTQPKNITEGFKLLLPKEVHNKNWERQGEWFAVPINKDKVPSEDKMIQIYSLALPRDNGQSNIHHLASCDSDDEMYEDPGIFVDPESRRIFAKKGWAIYHDEHQELDCPSTNQPWWEFHRNRAVRSYSEEGMD